MRTKVPAKPSIYLALCFFIFSVPIVWSQVSGHDWQRIAQVVIAFVSLVASIGYLKRQPGASLLKANARLCFGLIACLGVMSAAGSHQPSWAFIEIALLLACCCVVCTLAIEHRRLGLVFDRVVFFFIVILCSVKVFQFLCATAAVFGSGVGILDTTLLFEGFSNWRTYGQFQTFTLPVLALPLLLPSSGRTVKNWIFALLACWWMIAICGGTRGTWFGMAVACSVLSCISRRGRLWSAWQLAAAATGCLLYWLVFALMPSWLGIKALNFVSDRLTTNLSAREIIWQQAWEMIRAHPLLGYGPMHFADIPNYVAAHPHQSVLQWACEWGIPSTLLIIWLVLRGCGATAALIHKKAASVEATDILRLCLFASLVGALAQSMVDGVIVMPYSQLWLCLIVGWLMGIHEWKVAPTLAPAFLPIVWLIAAALSIAILGYAVIRDFPHLEDQQRQYAHDFGGNFQPRFWMQGVIASKAL